MKERGEGEIAAIVGIGLGVLLLLGLAGGLMAGCPNYGVYAQRKAGEAELAHAESQRQVIVVTAEAKKHAAKLEGEAEVARATGLAEANKIIGDSLVGHEAYLRYLWIQAMAHDSGSIIYVPTEAGLPVLEAGRRPEQEKR